MFASGNESRVQLIAHQTNWLRCFGKFTYVRLENFSSKLSKNGNL